MSRKIGLVICVVIVLLLAGCWNKKEPKDLAIINSIVYNKTQDGLYEVTVEFMDLTGASQKGMGGGGSSGNNFTTETAQGASYREALSYVSSTVEKAIYGGHNHVRFFSESAAKSDMAATMDFLLRDHLTDETPLIVVIKGDTPEKIYTSSMGLSDSVGVYIDNMEMTQKSTSSKSVFVTTLDFVKDFFNDGKEPVAGVVQIGKSKTEKKGEASENNSSQNNEGSDRLVYEGLAAFKGDKLVGYLDGKGARAYNFIIGKIGITILDVPFENTTAICEVTQSSTDIKTQVKDKAVTVNVKIKARMRVIGYGADENPSDPDIMKKIQEAFNKQLLPQIAETIRKAQKEFGSDIFGFGMSVHAQNPADWKRIKEEWNKIFPTATVTISVESDIYQTGETKDSVLSEFSEE